MGPTVKVNPPPCQTRAHRREKTCGKDVTSITILTCVTLGEPLHSVDKRLITVEMFGLLLASGVAPAVPLGVLGWVVAVVKEAGCPQLARRSRSSSVRPCLARGAGSTPRLVKRSARDAKQRRAPSATYEEKR